MMGLISGIVTTPQLTNPTQLLGENTKISNQIIIFSNQEQLEAEANNPNIQEERSTGSMWYWSKILLNIFTDIINPFSINPYMFNTIIEQFTATLISLFRFIFGLLIIIEIYLFFKNKKAT